MPPYTNPNSLVLQDSSVLYANSHWNALVANVHSAFVTAIGSAHTFAVDSGFLGPQVNSFGAVNASSSFTGPGSHDLGDLTVDRVNANSFLAVQSVRVMGLAQTVFAQRYVSQIN